MNFDISSRLTSNPAEALCLERTPALLRHEGLADATDTYFATRITALLHYTKIRSLIITFHNSFLS